MSSIFTMGFLTSGSLIVAIGSQNAYILKQGILRNHIVLVCTICFICDILLILLGALGVGGLINDSSTAMYIMAILGAGFLFIYGLNSFRSALYSKSTLTIDNIQNKDKKLLKIIFATLAVTLLNPHVYLDTVVVVGAIAGTLSFDERILFCLGALAASSLWFYGLGLAARVFRHILSRRTIWKVLEFSIGVIMWLISFSLIYKWVI